MKQPRYAPGKNYLFARILYKDKINDLIRKLGTYDPVHHDLVSVEVVLLKCVRMEAVSWEFDPKDAKDRLGFIFKEIGGEHGGRVFHNQYPSATVNQLEPDADYLVRIAPTKERLSELAAIKARFRDDWIEEAMSHYNDAFKLFSRVTQAISENRSATKAPRWDNNQLNEMQSLADKLQASIEASIGRRVGVRPTLTDDTTFETYLIETREAA